MAETLQAPRAHAHDDPNLAHHFEDLEQQRLSANLGLWTFLGTEVMFFGGLICGYIVSRFTSPDVFAAASRQLNVTIATINTVVLLTSSLAMAFAVHAGATGDRARQVRYLLLTAGLGLLFMAFKGYEYYEEYEKHLIPGTHFRTSALKLPAEPAPPGARHPADSSMTMRSASVLSIAPNEFVARRAQLFFIFYFFMTGLHLIHMIVGMGLVAWMIALARRGRFTPSYHTPLELTGLYWHFIDIVWVFLYPLLYLVALHK
ncbi:MAG: cytochrome c oxidase subunit 3 [Isosphaeraceae bacterium]